ncbi:L-dopachrome tautomerase-related protein [Sphingomonas oligophenolica]|uniref:L-dopachrome tautomerase-related protein n=1 Tax=Sphingomonas oligophenolica TaxID=301154 RepID=A0ABU9Y976_9SPHN
MFVSIQPQDGSPVEVAEVIGGALRPYPDRRWNGWHAGSDAATAFVGVNALRIGPDGALWVVDKGSRALGMAPLPGGTKVVRIDLANGRVLRSYDLAAIAGPGSFIDDIRFNGRHAYLTDVARGALVILDLESGAARRVLTGHKALTGKPLISADGPLHFPDGKAVIANADQLEVSPDGRWLYVQPASGGMSRIATRYLDDSGLSDEALGEHLEPFADTPPTGGTTIDAQGNIYLGDLAGSRILKVDPAGNIRTVITDKRLIWPDAMWIDARNRLWVPAAQLNRTRDLNGGVDAVRYPVRVYTVSLKK